MIELNAIFLAAIYLAKNIDMPKMMRNHATARRYALKCSVQLAGLAGLAINPLSSFAATTESRYGIVGYDAPELDVDYWIDEKGKPDSFSISESKGKWIFLKCFQSWCPGCHSSGFPTLKAFSDEFHEHPQVAIAGIQTVFEGFSTNTQDEVRKLQLRYELPITMGHDAGNSDGIHQSDIMVKYRTGGTPWLILINPEGKVVFNEFRVDTDKLIAYIHEQVA